MTSYHANMPKSVMVVVLGSAALLSIPYIAMQFTREVNWGLGDFVIMGILLFTTGMAYVLITRTMQNRNQRLTVAGVLLLAFLYIWAELAVGIFTNLGS